VAAAAVGSVLQWWC